ncbi:MAG: ribonuclease HII [Acidobacteriota bacterium]|uniref:Ribonuclease HII n=1 Tax=marine metagenome TaxID=408172 RepID=A0A382KCL5_9ZZZZ|nr:ribonuclease HII [Acidobacteriota bacterium]MEE2609375.1 ribonuclease HII [Acidobacteriota bacterium]MEE3137895.1 ribonuclease HII [Acidobacteriota bacterium]|tara:strand:- start:389 stop:1012 length:624 start_codon:yes stop_codon:yes gene_type:complete
MPRPAAPRTIENAIRRLGFARVAGVDEVGRGCLAGPLVAAVVVLNPDRHIPGVCDSKLLSASARECLYEEIIALADGWSVGWASPLVIDNLNVHQATFSAMRNAVMSLVTLPDFVLVDGFIIPNLELPQRHIIGGDRRCAAIAAASIVAKVTRDRHMKLLHERDPRYGFDRHKGYPTARHLAAIGCYGYSIVHRRSFHCSSLSGTPR